MEDIISNRISTGIVIAAVAVTSFFTFACGSPPEPAKTEKPANTNSNAKPTERETSGVFNVTGAGTNGIDEYKGVLNITNQGDVYGFRWQTNRGSRVGNGVQIGDAMAASYAAIAAGKGCGVVLYKIASDGSLDGKVAKWGETTFGTEKATRTEGHGFVGKYSITGQGNDGKDYSGTLSITKDGAGYDFEWKTDKPLVGFGIWKGSTAAVSFGGPQCSFALYDIQSNGNLEGDWGGQKSVTFGKETAKRQ